MLTARLFVGEAEHLVRSRSHIGKGKSGVYIIQTKKVIDFRLNQSESLEYLERLFDIGNLINAVRIEHKQNNWDGYGAKPVNADSLIRERGFIGGILYVGESHTGRLGTTLLRHFQHWTGPTAGPTFPVSKVEVAIVKTRAGNALETQDAIIAEYAPELNVVGKPKGFWETLFGS